MTPQDEEGFIVDAKIVIGPDDPIQEGTKFNYGKQGHEPLEAGELVRGKCEWCSFGD